MIRCCPLVFIVSLASMAQTPAPVVTGLVNAVSFGPAVSPGSMAAIYGRDLAGSTANCAIPAGYPVDWCADVQVVVADSSRQYFAAVVFVSPAQILAQMPVELPAGSCTIRVTRRVGGQQYNSQWLPFTLESYSPALYTSNQSGKVLGTFLDQSNKVINQGNPAKPGDNISLYADGLGRTRPVVPTGQKPPTTLAPTETTPKVTVAGLPATVLWSGLNPGSVGLFLVNIKVPAVSGGDRPVVLEIGGKQSNSVLLPVNGPQLPEVVAVVNQASGEPGVAAGSWISIYGANLASAPRLWGSADFAGNKMPTNLDGVSVTVNGKPAAISFVSASQINAQAPTDSATGAVAVEVRNSLGAGSGSALLQAYAPGFTPFFGFEQGKYLAGVHPDGVYLGKRDLFQGALASRPARPGGVILLFGTGFGATAPAVPAGELFSGAAPLADLAQFSIKIGGVAAEVQFAGLVGAGLYQFNVVVPAVAAGDQMVVAEIAGVRSQANKFITVE